MMDWTDFSVRTDYRYYLGLSDHFILVLFIILLNLIFTCVRVIWKLISDKLDVVIIMT